MQHTTQNAYNLMEISNIMVIMQFEEVGKFQKLLEQCSQILEGNRTVPQSNNKPLEIHIDEKGEISEHAFWVGCEK